MPSKPKTPVRWMQGQAAAMRTLLARDAAKQAAAADRNADPANLEGVQAAGETRAQITQDMSDIQAYTHRLAEVLPTAPMYWAPGPVVAAAMRPARANMTMNLGECAPSPTGLLFFQEAPTGMDAGGGQEARFDAVLWATDPWSSHLLITGYMRTSRIPGASQKLPLQDIAQMHLPTMPTDLSNPRTHGFTAEQMPTVLAFVNCLRAVSGSGADPQRARDVALTVPTV